MRAFVFPGQGAQKVGMGQDLVDAFAVARKLFEQADAALGYSLSKLCFEGPEEELKLTANAQPAILTVSVALLRAIEEQEELAPEIVAGHSLGEYSALVCAGALAFEDAVRLVHKRGLFMQEAVPVGQGAMAAVLNMEPAAIEALCQEAAEGQVLCPANFNSPKQTVIAGHATAVQRAMKLVKEKRGVAKELPVSAPFHCPLMEPAAARLAKELEQVRFKDPTIPVVTNVEAAPNSDGSRVAALLARQVTAPVRWTDSVRKMIELGVTEFHEVGPGRALSGLIKQIEKEAQVTNFETVEQVEALAWDRQEGRKVHRKSGKIVWDDGLVWDPNEPGAFGF